MEAQELRIEAPWGHIAGKVWGEAESPVVLMFHGIMDNASSFNRLVPLLPRRYRYASIDLPGHGFSSHFPQRLPLHAYNNLLAYRIVCRHFAQQRYIFIGHSFGGQLSMVYAQLYPDSVERIVLLDTINLIPVPASSFGDYLSDKLDSFLDLDKRLNSSSGAPIYRPEEALDRLQNNRRYSAITTPAAEALFERAVRPVGTDGRVSFTVDPRLKMWLNPTKDFRYTVESMRHYPIRCPVLIVLAKGTGAQEVYFMPILKRFRAMKNVTITKVEGTHDVHNDHPERVAPAICRFLDAKAKL